MTCPVYGCIVAYTVQVTFYKVPENTAMFFWSGCMLYRGILANILHFEEKIHIGIPNDISLFKFLFAAHCQPQYRDHCTTKYKQHCFKKYSTEYNEDCSVSYDDLCTTITVTKGSTQRLLNYYFYLKPKL